MDIKILGAGVWGRALSGILKQNNPQVTLVDKNEKITEADLLVLSVPTQSLRSALNQVEVKKKLIVVNTAKGIEKDTHLLPYQIITSILKTPLDYYSLIGPSFAGEVSLNMPTLVNLGFREKSPANQKVRDIFQTNLFRVRLTAGFEILELSSAFKNIYAISCGIADGLGYGVNTRTKLIVLAIEEMSRLFSGLKYKVPPDSVAGTTGDLILTCSSPESRNYTFGTLLTKLKVKEALVEVNSTVEGYHSLASVPYFERKANSKLPLARFVKDVIDQDDPMLVHRTFGNFIKNT